ncbi:MAG: alpha/beta hydrolase-fold protein [Dehalococcoidia bacterium]|nr:alpha/beta hydrolase-fold protein [Dehalococcoidia bacterium]
MQLRGSLAIHQIAHPSLEGNWLGDPVERAIPVYYPPGYPNDGPYPVVYFLPGYTGTGLSRTNVYPFEPNLIERFDRAVAAGVAPPSLFVCADGFTRYGGSQYINSLVNGAYQDAIADDLTSWIDDRCPTVRGPEGRVVMGVSSGGYGAILLGMQRPDRFGLVVSYSGDMYFDYCYAPDFPKYARVFERHGGVAPFLEWFRGADPVPNDAVSALMIVAMAACYSPNLEAPGGVDMPFDFVTGELRVDVWRRWKAHDPVELVERHADALRSLRLLYFECGLRDEFHLHYGARIFAQRLRAHGVAHQHAEFDGGHSGLNYRLTVTMPIIGDALRAAR